MKIGVIGPSDSLKKIMNLKKDLEEDVLLQAYEAHTLQDAIDLAEKCQNETDGIFFSGPSVHGAVISKCNIYKPHSYAPHSAFGLLSLFYKQIDNEYKQFSIDVVSPEATTEIPLEMEGYHFDILPYEIYHSEKDYIAFHNENISNGSEAVITTFASIYNYFRKKNIPVYRLHTTDFDMKYTLKLLILEIQKRELSRQRAAVQIMKFKFPTTLGKYESNEKKLKLEILFNQYAKLCNGSIISHDNTYKLYTTKQFLNNSATHIHYFDMLRSLDYKLYSGIGYGSSIYQAEVNAEKALTTSLEEKTGNVFVLDDQLILRGPYSHSPFSIDEPMLDKDTLLQASQKIDLSEEYISRIYTIMKSKKVDSFTAKEFAHYLDISSRSANRILKKFSDGGYGKVIDSIQPGKSGRPVNVVKITL